MDEMIPKAEWGDGPWQQERDEQQYIDTKTGYPCRIRRNMIIGNLCGYVGVPPNHPCYGLSGDQLYRILGRDGDVHGGVTFTGLFSDAVHHRSAWYVGFDCGHFRDLCPGILATLRAIGFPRKESKEGDAMEVYRDWQYVEQQVRGLADALYAVRRSYIKRWWHFGTLGAKITWAKR